MEVLKYKLHVLERTVNFIQDLHSSQTPCETARNFMRLTLLTNAFVPLH